MSERRFVIREIYEGEDPESIYWITESELKRRLELIAAIIANTNGGWREPDLQRSIVVLLNGEGEKGEDKVQYCPECQTRHPWDEMCPDNGEKGEEPPAGLFHGPGLPTREQQVGCKHVNRVYGKNDDYCLDCGKHGLPKQPSPAPTREEWEAWAERLSTAITINDYYSEHTQRLDIEQVLLSMPIVPKE